MEVENSRTGEQSIQNEELTKPPTAEQEPTSTLIATINGNDTEVGILPVNSKDSQKPSPKKPKKRKPKVPRDVTAPRQPLTGGYLLRCILFLNIFFFIYILKY